MPSARSLGHATSRSPPHHQHAQRPRLSSCPHAPAAAHRLWTRPSICVAALPPPTPHLLHCRRPPTPPSRCPGRRPCSFHCACGQHGHVVLSLPHAAALVRVCLRSLRRAAPRRRRRAVLGANRRRRRAVLGEALLPVAPRLLQRLDVHQPRTLRLEPRHLRLQARWVGPGRSRSPRCGLIFLF